MKQIVLTLVMLTCLGCASLQTAYFDDWNQGPRMPLERRMYWLKTADFYMTLSPQQARQRLDASGTQVNTSLQWFRSALLNQQLAEREGWVRARDAYRHLLTDETLGVELQNLINLSLKYNQEMINWDERYKQIAEELSESQAAQKKLEEKIQALTNLEQNMSSRKEQVIEN